MNFLKSKASGHKKVTSTLKKYAMLRSFKVLTDYTCNYKDKVIKIDNILVGFFGIIVVTDIDVEGEVYIENGRNVEWLNISNNQKSKIGNPLTDSTEQINAIRTMLRDAKIPNSNVENLIVFTCKTIEIYKPPKTPIINITSLSKYLHQSKYDIDNEYDVENIVSVLNKNAN